MSALTVQIFVENFMDVFEHYKRAFNAVLLSTANGSQNEEEPALKYGGLQKWKMYAFMRFSRAKWYRHNAVCLAMESLKKFCEWFGGLPRSMFSKDFFMVR